MTGEGKEMVPETPPPHLEIVLDRDSSLFCLRSTHRNSTHSCPGSGVPLLSGRGARRGAEWRGVDFDLGRSARGGGARSCGARARAGKDGVRTGLLPFIRGGELRRRACERGTAGVRSPVGWNTRTPMPRCPMTRSGIWRAMPTMSDCYHLGQRFSDD